MKNLGWILIGTIIAILPIYLIKKYILTNNYLFIGLTLCAYIILTIAYIKIFRTNEEISVIYTFLQILQIFLVVFIGIIIFKEKLTKNKFIGIFLGCIAIYFLSIK